MDTHHPRPTLLTRCRRRASPAALVLQTSVSLAGALLTGCNGTVPSQRMQSAIRLPLPASSEQPPPPERLLVDTEGDVYELSAQSLIAIAFNLQPDIKSSFERFKSEEARYDFFFASRDSLTPRMRVTNRFNEFRANESVTRTREHTAEFSIEKRFFDTTQLDVAVGYRTDGINEAIGNQPFVSATLRYPLWVSREKLERTSEDIFRQNELNDTQLGYIQQVRRRLQNVLFRFHEVRDLGRRVSFYQEWLDELGNLERLVDSIDGRDVTTDRRRLNAESARVSSELRNVTGRDEIQIARFKSACGLPFNAQLKLSDEPFNPFVGADHQELLQVSIETDPEIATLRNSMRNAEVQLDLARRGTWDFALLVSGASSLEGRGEATGVSDWNASLGIDVRHVDQRVTKSLSRQAKANIARFAQAIAARENSIFVDTLEPLIRIETLSASGEELTGNLTRFVEDYATGVAAYRQGTLNIDDLLSRRETLFMQQREISRLTFLVGANVAELCAATGKFFELLEEYEGTGEREGDVFIPPPESG